MTVAVRRVEAEPPACGRMGVVQEGGRLTFTLTVAPEKFDRRIRVPGGGPVNGELDGMVCGQGCESRLVAGVASFRWSAPIVLPTEAAGAAVPGGVRRYDAWHDDQTWYAPADTVLPADLLLDGVSVCVSDVTVSDGVAGWPGTLGGSWSWPALRAGVWTGGYARVARAAMPLWVHPSLSAAAQDVAQAAVAVAASQAPWLPHELPVIVIPAGSPWSSGTNRGDAVVLELASNHPPAPAELTSLLAHEAMHRLLGYRRTTSERWLLEGVDEYLALWSLAHADASWRPALLRRLLTAIDALESASAMGVGARDQLGSPLVYHLGVALGASLELERARSGARPLIEAVAGEAGAVELAPNPETAARMSLVATRGDGQLAAGWLRDGLGRAGLTLAVRSIREATLGLAWTGRLDGSAQVEWVAPGSGAATAGIRAGDLLFDPPSMAGVRGGEAVQIRWLGSAGERTGRFVTAWGTRALTVVVGERPAWPRGLSLREGP